MTHYLNAFLTHFTYLALVLLLVVAGTGVPLPEDIPLITAGYLCNPVESPIAKANLEDVNEDGVPNHPPRHVPNLYIMMAAGMIGVLVGDSLVFSIGRKGLNSQGAVARHVRKVMHSKRRERVEHHFARHGNLTVFAGRFMPGFRSLIFAFAGMSKMSYPRFLLIDGVAAAISVPVFIFLGHYFADRISLVGHVIDRGKYVLLGIVAVGVIIFLAVRKKRGAAVEQA